ncbi:MAG: flavodoxin domain-containing protein [Oscillospiraceae bacterium]|nr:flavodoxin domain-containing protein [Oscillospiraceae bacterium]
MTKTKGIILYQSKYGASKKYALWLQEKSDFDCMEIRQCKTDMLSAYDTIILCGGIYASGIAGLSFLKKHSDILQTKQIAIFCVGASPYDETTLKAIKERNLQREWQDTPLFYGRGAWDMEKMSAKDRFLCKMLQKAVAKKDPSTYEPWMTALMEAIGKQCDWTDSSYLTPLLQWIAAKEQN